MPVEHPLDLPLDLILDPIGVRTLTVQNIGQRLQFAEREYAGLAVQLVPVARKPLPTARHFPSYLE